MTKLSIVVPIYNVEKYLERCLESLKNQTLDDYEVILVNDGSKDNSEKICKKYCKENDKFIYFKQENSGLSAARNSGIKLAKGEYIGFVDSDDFVDLDMFEILYNNAIQNSVDISACGHKSYYENGKITINSKKNIKKKYTREEALDLFLIQELFDVVAWNKIYKRHLFNDIIYPVGKVYEDIQTTYKLINKSNGVYFDSNAKYYYFQRSNSISHASFDQRMLWILDGIEEFKKILETNKSYYNQPVGEIRWNLVVYNKMLKSSVTDKNMENKIKKMIKHNFKNILLNKYNSCTRKIQILLFGFSTSLYKKLYLRK